MCQERLLSILPGLVVRLSRAKVLAGALAEAGQWMAMLTIAWMNAWPASTVSGWPSRSPSGCEGTARAVLVSVHGADGASFDPDSAIDRDHLEQAKRIEEPGWTEAEPQLLLLPGPVRDAALSWALPGRQGPAPGVIRVRGRRRRTGSTVRLP
jgi:hypothetical protein